ncbi:MAG: hypothetical protein KDD02_01085 [Phaeodactylibacter sp.]|nr:hypothetical protein [Phaeodactylibacter sp.]MCB0572428.1 hypothetical protein [Phaeodactylibacter sp.]MCB9303253.1 hypothetical protein [Lewinellaceae bacterium]HQU58315.1 hypothetical protein [Saprospiraceae bacterium]
MDETKAYCRYLRAKNAFGTMEGGGRPFLPEDPGTTTYWCIRTMGPAGPDGRLAHISTCTQAERPCYKKTEEETKGGEGA